MDCVVHGVSKGHTRLSDFHFLTTVCDHWEDHSLYYTGLRQQSNVSAFNTLSTGVIAFLPRSKHFLILWLQSPSTVILEPKKKKSVTTSTFPTSICHEVMGQDAMILVFSVFSFKAAISLSFTLIKMFFSSLVL